MNGKNQPDDGHKSEYDALNLIRTRELLEPEIYKRETNEDLNQSEHMGVLIRLLSQSEDRSQDHEPQARDKEDGQHHHHYVRNHIVRGTYLV